MKNTLQVPDSDPECLEIGTVYPYTVMTITALDGRESKLIIDSAGAKMRFEGDVEKSAKTFFDEIVKHHLPKSESQ